MCIRDRDMAKPFEFNIKKLYADLRPSEQKVADYYLGYAGQLEELSLVPMAKAAGVSPVSYTHLDVYKRQTVWCPLPSHLL